MYMYIYISLFVFDHKIHGRPYWHPTMGDDVHERPDGSAASFLGRQQQDLTTIFLCPDPATVATHFGDSSQKA